VHVPPLNLGMCWLAFPACSATNVVSGQATAVVVATGDSAEIGHISKMVNTVSGTGPGTCVCDALTAGLSRYMLVCRHHEPWAHSVAGDRHSGGVAQRQMQTLTPMCAGMLCASPAAGFGRKQCSCLHVAY
jgi:magnesium-transporting ATPase (P-type)